MPSYSCEVLVLRERPLGEADRILTLLGRDRGCFQAVARGVRKTSSRLAGSLLVFSHSKLLLWQGRSLDGISQAQVMTSFRRLREDLDVMACASLAAEVAVAMGTELPVSSREHSSIEVREHQRGFDLLLAFFRVLEQQDLAPEESIWALALYLARHLAFAGFMPRLDRCQGCGVDLQSPARFDPAAGVFYCLACGGGMGAPLDVETIVAWRRLLTLRWEELRTLRPDTNVVYRLQHALCSQTEAILEHELKARRFLDIIGDGGGSS